MSQKNDSRKAFEEWRIEYYGAPANLDRADDFARFVAWQACEARTRKDVEELVEVLSDLIPLYTAPQMFDGWFQEEKERRFSKAMKALAKFSTNTGKVFVTQHSVGIGGPGIGGVGGSGTIDTKQEAK